jgi:tryptophan synthase alpha chain
VERIRFIDNISGGFIYMVSTSSTTGSKDSFDERQSEYFRRIQDMNLKTPILTGFGISNYQTFKAASRYTNGAIIGSAYIKALGEKSVDLRKKTEFFISGLKKPL